MSQHKVKTKNPSHTCTVGYDHGLKTFFAQVEDTEIERAASEAANRVADAYEKNRKPDAAVVAASCKESLVLWVGASRVSEIPTAARLAKLLEPYADLDAAMIETLRSEQVREESTPRTQHQINMLDRVMKNTRA